MCYREHFDLWVSVTTKGWTKLLIGEIHYIHCAPYIIRVTKWRTVRWASHVTGMVRDDNCVSGLSEKNLRRIISFQEPYRVTSRVNLSSRSPEADQVHSQPYTPRLLQFGQKEPRSHSGDEKIIKIDGRAAWTRRWWHHAFRNLPIVTGSHLTGTES